MNPDYSHLYRTLGLQPDCSLAAFRQAYRRHVGSQHPDKGSTRRLPDEMSLPLPEVIALYDQAMRFHRRYGRLPGTTPLPHLDRLAPAASDGLPGADASSRAARSPTGGSRWLLLVAVLAVLLLAVGRPWQTAPVHAPMPQAGPDPSMSLSDTEPLPDTLALGMDASTVLAIQGQPVKRSDEQWEYGPSWVRFEKGRLSDWYSSPFYRLKTATPIPQAPRHDE